MTTNLAQFGPRKTIGGDESVVGRTTASQVVGQTIKGLFAALVGLVGGCMTLMLLAAGDCTRRGAGFIGCGDGIPDWTAAAKCWFSATGLAIATVFVFRKLLNASTDRSDRSQSALDFVD